MNSKGCSIKVRFFTIVLNTANLINETTTPNLGMSHSLIAPVTIFSTYMFLSVFIVGALRKRYASYFLQIYGVTTCFLLQIMLSISVFNGLRTAIRPKQAPFVLNGLLPMITICLLVADLAITILSSRHNILFSPSHSSTPPD